LTNSNVLIMKRLTILFALLFSLSFVWAQPSGDVHAEDANSSIKYTMDVPDFTVTDSDGERWTLYDMLDDGKTVIIDFFQST